jgi:hypothetical protein
MFRKETTAAIVELQTQPLGRISCDLFDSCLVMLILMLEGYRRKN